MLEVNKFEALKIGIASPDKIKEWSHGEVTKPETINYRTLRMEKEGLFCEKTFGPTKDYECSCGKYKGIRYKGVVCDRCGVEVTSSKVRRERMGHIDLASPVSHIWFFKGVPSRMALLLDLSPRDLEEILYFVSYVVLDKKDTTLEYKQLLSEREYQEYYAKYGTGFRVGMGAEAVKELLNNIDLEKEIDMLNEEIETATSQKKDRLLKRLDVVDAIHKSGNHPSWMILDTIPVIPPDLRPMIQLDGGRFATSDLNDLYRRVINRNNRLKRLIELDAPGIIIQNEKRMLQEAVDSLFDNGRRGRAVTGAGNRPLKSLSSNLKSKQGRFRQNLLGKRVDYSGRSVIVVGPSLKMHQCGIPKEMALELFKPHILHGLVKQELAANIKAAKKMVESQDEQVWDIVEEIIKEHPVMLNRAPTLHRLSIQAFEPVLIGGKAIRLHPLVCTAFNADFDGDQMAVHVPLSEEAKTEARVLMLGANNILHPKDGSPIVEPSQDMVLGNYYVTMEKHLEDGKVIEGEGRLFKDSNEALMAYERSEISLHARIAVPARSFKYKLFTEDQKSKYLVTTVGKLKFNEMLPDSFPYINEPTKENINTITPDKFFLEMGSDIKEEIAKMPLVQPFAKKFLGDIIAQVFKRYKTTETSIMLDKMKDLGFKHSTLAGITIALSDIVVSESKDEIVKSAQERVDKINKQYDRGLITNTERYDRVIETWEASKNEVQKELDIASKDIENIENPLFVMMNSNARGNISNITQLAGMRGIMAKPSGENVEIPIVSSFKDGLSVAEFFLSTHGARKGLADTALKTADSGYLTRRLVDVGQDIIIREEDCETENGVVVKDIINDKDNTIIEGLYDRIVGRYSNAKIVHPKTKEVIVEKDVFITEYLADKVLAAGVTEVEIRSILTCNTKNGICEKCYGRNLATGNPVEVGEAVGVMAAQSIGEPGTQLTMRTFHTGGVAGDDITQGLPRIQELFEARIPKGKATIAEIDGTVTEIEEDSGKYIITIKSEVGELKDHITNYGAKPRVETGAEVSAGDKLTHGAISPKELLDVTDALTTQEYILKEVQHTYRSQGVDISDKHIEIVASRMINRMRISDPGSTNFLQGSMVSFQDYAEGNKEAILEGKKPSRGKPVILGITKASLQSDSFLSAASFQETTKVLTDAAIRGKVDNLVGLKENIIVGKLIPAGTGLKKYKNIEYELKSQFIDEEPIDALEDVFM